MNRKSDDPQTLPPMQVLPVAPGVPSLVPLQARQVLPITPGVPSFVPLQALPVTPLSTREEALTEALREAREQLADADDMRRTVLQYYGTQRADRTGRARRAGSTPKRKIASEHAEWVEHWVAEVEYRLQLGIRPRKDT